MFVFNLVQVMSGLEEGQNINDLPKFSPWDADLRLYTRYLNKDALKIENLASVRHLVHEDIARRDNGLVFAKTHWPIARVSGHATFNFSVTAGAVYSVRNPLDVAVSFAHHLDKSIDAAIQLMSTPKASLAFGKDLAELLGSWSENVVSWTRNPAPDICVLRYEDMIEDPELWFGVVARHIFNPAPTRDQISKAIRLSSFQNLKAQEQQRGFMQADKTRPFFREGRIGQWRNVLTPPQIDRIVRDHGEQMRKFGYLPLN